jgi:hypothetical protein
MIAGDQFDRNRAYAQSCNLPVSARPTNGSRRCEGWETRSRRVRAERRAGELLREMPKNEGASAGGEKDGPRGTYVVPRDETPTFADLGISKNQSSRWQKLAVVSGAFERSRRQDLLSFEHHAEIAKLAGVGKDTMREQPA